jgi:trimeric autotransporter adhesin
MRMKKLAFFIVSLFMVVSGLQAQNIGIGTSSPNANAQLEIASNSKGILIPRLTSAQMQAIVNPPIGLMVFNTDSVAFAYRNASAWEFLKGNINGSSNWNTLGNTGTNPGTHFIGTTDDQDLVFKRNNLRAGLLNDASKNTSFGIDALSVNTTGFSNTALGGFALRSNATGFNNTATGVSALESNVNGSRNTANGVAALYLNLSGSFNTANGENALYSNQTGNENTAYGSFTLNQNVSGSFNTAIGTRAGSSTSGSGNVFLGYSAGSIETGSNKLYINNNFDDANNALIYGEFDNKLLRTNGRMEIFSKTDVQNALNVVSPFVTDGLSQAAISGLNTHTGTGTHIGVAGTANGLNPNTLGAGRNIGVLGEAAGSSGNVIGVSSIASSSGSLGLVYGVRSEVTASNGAIAYGVNASAVGNSSNAYGIQGIASGSTVGNFGVRGEASGNNGIKYGVYGEALGTGTNYAGYFNGPTRVEGSLGVGEAPSANFPLGIKARNNGGNDDLLLFYTSASVSKWHLNMISGALNFAESNVADRRLILQPGGNVGVGRTPTTNRLEVEGTASNAVGGAWAVNSDSRLKKNIKALNGEDVLEKLLQLKGISYEWNDDKTGYKRPEGLQYGFIAQNIQAVFPDKVQTDHLGYLQTAYGNYDPLFIEAIRVLNEKIKLLEEKNLEIASQEEKIKKQEDRITKLEAMVQQLLEKK